MNPQPLPVFHSRHTIIKKKKFHQQLMFCQELNKLRFLYTGDNENKVER
jgi:hypothetical protein